MERPLIKPIGSRVDELDTPALVVDLSAFEGNLAAVHGYFQRRRVKLRPQVHAHKTPALAHRQLAVPGAARGVAVVSVGEAEVFGASGIRDLVITTPVVTPAKLDRVCALAHTARVALAVDAAASLEALSKAAARTDATVDVLVAVQTHPTRPGAPPGPAVVALAEAAGRAPGVRFAGLLTTGGPTLADARTRVLRTAARDAARALAGCRRAVEAAGLAVEVCSFGDGAAAYDAVAAVPGITEVRSDAYALQDGLHLPHGAGKGLRAAVRVLTTVTSRPEPNRAITDCGQKAISRDLGLPAVDGRPDHVVPALSAEHGYVERADGRPLDLGIGDRLWLVPADASGAFAVHDLVYGVRDGVVEGVWAVAARGRFQ